MKRFLKYDTEDAKNGVGPVDKNGVIKKDISGGGGMQPDWNQNDSTQPNYVKNRPFYTGDPVETVMLPETTITIEAKRENLISRSFPYSFEPGKTYVITFDGVDTEYTAYEAEGRVCVGYDYSSAAGGSGYIIMASNGAIGLLTLDTSLNGSHTIAIKGYTQEIIKIDEKYLPEHKYISYEEQELTDSQKEIARNNINAVDNSIFIEIPTNVISASDFDIYYEKYRKTGLPIKWEDAFINYIFHRYTNGDEGIKTYELISNSQLYSMTEYVYNGQKKVSHSSWKVRPKNIFAYQISMTNTGIPSIHKTLELNYGGKIVTDDGYEIMMWNGKELYINSSTTGSTKKFKITVDDSGTITATEVT